MSATLAVSHRAGVLGVGYEGRSIDEFVLGLADIGVTRLVNVRLTPIGCATPNRWRHSTRSPRRRGAN